MKQVITGAHIIIGSTEPEADRAFFRDVLGFESVDVGEGWLIFALPPAELAVHPAKDGGHELYLMCADLESAMRELQDKGVAVRPAISEQSWGRLASIVLPGGSELSIYEPRHPGPPQHRTEIAAAGQPRVSRPAESVLVIER